MSRIKARVMSGQNATPGREAGYQPVTGGQASPPAVMVMPVSRVSYAQTGPWEVTLGLDELVPVPAQGDPAAGMPPVVAVPAASPGRHGKLRKAGRP